MKTTYVGITERIEIAVGGTVTATTAPTLYVNGSSSAVTVTVDSSTAYKLILTHTTTGRTVGDILTYIGGTATVGGVAYPIVVDPRYVDAAVNTRMATYTQPTGFLATTFAGTVGTSTLTQAQVTGGAYALNTDGSGYVKLSAGTGTGQISLTSGAVTFANTTIGTVTTLTNLPTAPTDWLTAAAVKADAVTKIQSGLSFSLGTNAPANWINAASIATNALNGKGDWATVTTIKTDPAFVTMFAQIAVISGWTPIDAEDLDSAEDIATTTATLIEDADGLLNSTKTAVLSNGTAIAGVAANAATAASEATAGHTAVNTIASKLPGSGQLIAGVDDVQGGGGSIGPGASSNVVTIESNGEAVSDADVWITTDAEGMNTIAGTLQTNSIGKVTFLLDSGVTYYLWMQKDGENPIVGQSFVAD